MKPLFYLLLFLGHSVWGQEMFLSTDEFGSIETQLYEIAESARRNNFPRATIKITGLHLSKPKKISLHHINDTLTELKWYHYTEQYSYSNRYYTWLYDYDTLEHQKRFPTTTKEIVFENQQFTETKKYFMDEGDSILQSQIYTRITVSKDTTIIIDNYRINNNHRVNKTCVYAKDSSTITDYYERLNDQWIRKSTSSITTNLLSYDHINTWQKIHTYRQLNLMPNEKERSFKITSSAIYHIHKNKIIKVSYNSVDEFNLIDQFDIKVKYRN
jgi:hypothetical protein